MIKNQWGQTLLSLIEVNRECLPESLALVLKHEYGCHHRSMKQTELCLSRQLDSSDSAKDLLPNFMDMVFAFSDVTGS
jgi:hypothetical protein